MPLIMLLNRERTDAVWRLRFLASVHLVSAARALPVDPVVDYTVLLADSIQLVLSQHIDTQVARPAGQRPHSLDLAHPLLE